MSTARATCLMAIAILVVASCRLQYNEKVSADSLSESIPDLQIENGSFSVFRGGYLNLKLDAKVVKIFSKGGRRDMQDVVFEQYDVDGKVLARGTAGSASQNIQTENVDFDQKLSVEIVKEKASIKADFLHWDAGEKSFRSKPDGVVELSKSDGTSITGKNFFADLPKRQIELGGGVEGVLVDSGGSQ